MTTSTLVPRCLPLQRHGEHHNLHLKPEDMMFELLSVFITNNCYLIKIFQLLSTSNKNTSTQSICNRAYNYFCIPSITPSSVSHAPYGDSHSRQYLRQDGDNMAGNTISLWYDSNCGFKQYLTQRRWHKGMFITRRYYGDSPYCAMYH